MQTRLNLLEWTIVARAFIVRSRFYASVPMLMTASSADSSLPGDKAGSIMASGDGLKPSMYAWAPVLVFLASLLAFVGLTPRITTYLDPTTGDEPYYLMTAISILKDGDINECNNYLERDSAKLYPEFYVLSEGEPVAPAGWKGWDGSPYPLGPHPAQIPANRQCITLDPTGRFYTLGPGTELYSKHGLGLTLLVLPSFSLGGRTLVVYFLNLLGALLALNVFCLARESTNKTVPAVLTWVAFTFTIPFLAYSFLIFPELPAALVVVYAFRRIRLWENNRWQIAAVGFSMAFLPWLHYRFIPVTAGLLLYYLYQEYRHRTKRRSVDLAIVSSQLVIAAASLMAFFYHRYGQITPNSSDHAGSNDIAGTLRGAAGLFYDEQWGLLIASPIFVLAVVGVVVMALKRGWRKDLLWLGIVFVPYFGVIANYAQWWGEWCPPARYMVSTLPLLAMPFAVSLEQINRPAYKGLYALLLVLSLGMMWGFMYQPQWMYHQPNGRNQVFEYGVPELLSNTGFSEQAPVVSARLMNLSPSFVRPYFEYASEDKARGDAASRAAWQTSLWLFLSTIVIVVWSLLLPRDRPDRLQDSALKSGAGLADYGTFTSAKGTPTE
ncbi:MAG: hypothetical protein ABIO92_09725 [Chloroflexia bacterium]